jgi:ABC-type sugar transport system ATPase subunit
LTTGRDRAAAGKEEHRARFSELRALYPHMTALENICFPLEIKKIPKKNSGLSVQGSWPN